MANNGKVLGIDLGTTNSAMAVLEGDVPTIITNSDGDRTTASVVGYRDGKRIVGKTALSQRVLNVENTIYSVKRFIGRVYDELTDIDKDGLAYEIQEGSNGRPVIMADIDGDGQKDELLPEQVSAAVLAKMKDDAEKFLGQEIKDAVITVPAYFNDTQRQATKDAGKIAGLNVLRIINEPTAAALAYGFGKDDGKERRLMVFDLGGGTLDISILEVSSNIVEVISTAGDNHLGGDLWDSEFTNYIESRFQDEYGLDISADPQIHARVLEACRDAKHSLSTAEVVNINLPFIGMNDKGPVHLNYDITREEFEAATAHLLERCRKPVLDALRPSPDANPMLFNDIDEILLVGGSTRMPAIQEFVHGISGKTPEMTINPDEAVALGAAIQGGVLNGECRDIVLADVASMSLGIKSYPSNSDRPVVSHMIARNSTLPASHTEQFTNREDNQTSVEIVLIQGEDDDPNSPENKNLGSATLDGITPMPAGRAIVDVTLTYNTDGIIELTAVERSTGKSISATMNDATRLSDHEVMRLAAAEQNQKK